MSDLVLEYALSLVRATRASSSDAPDFVRSWVMIGAGPRGGLSVLTSAKARAALAGRAEVDVDDVRAVAKPALRHRLVLSYAAEAEGQDPDAVVDRLLAAVPVHPDQGALGERVAELRIRNLVEPAFLGSEHVIEQREHDRQKDPQRGISRKLIQRLLPNVYPRCEFSARQAAAKSCAAAMAPSV